jgi:poly-gamma-glutamate capsule biosynthesis protein CapA/YwtB (metallophosphatase superfamily)
MKLLQMLFLFAFSLLNLACRPNSPELVINFAGDLMLDRGVKKSLGKKQPEVLFESIKSVFANANYTMVNFESASCDSILTQLNKKYIFNSPVNFLETLKIYGITHAALANNHSGDFGKLGLNQTVNNLLQAGIQPIGLLGKDSTYLPEIIEKDGIKVVVFNASFLVQDSSLTFQTNAVSLANEIKKFKLTNPNAFVIAYLHWGKEMEPLPTFNQIEEAHILIDAGSDCIIGHHPHVVQIIEKYKEKFIFYSLGNFVFDNGNPPANKGIVVSLSIDKWGKNTFLLHPFVSVNSKPIPMNEIEMELFLEELGNRSKSINLVQKEKIWELN